MRVARVVVPLMMLCGASVAHGMGPGKLSYTPQAEVTVPVNPSIVIPNRWRSTLTIENEEGDDLPYTLSPVGAYWTRVDITAAEGTRVRCNYDSLVRRVSSRWTRPAVASAIRSARVVDGRIVLETSGLRDAAAMRTDWAFTRDDLSAGRAGTWVSVRYVHMPSIPLGSRPGHVTPTVIEPKVEIPLSSDHHLVFVRVTELFLDGTAALVWEGWVVRDPGTGGVRIGRGPAPAVDDGRRCDAAPPWVVGENPSFVYRAAWPTIRAATLDGRELATRLDDDSFTTVTVAARAGQVFRLETMPPGTDCPLEVRVDPRGAGACDRSLRRAASTTAAAISLVGPTGCVGTAPPERRAMPRTPARSRREPLAWLLALLLAAALVEERAIRHALRG